MNILIESSDGSAVNDADIESTLKFLLGDDICSTEWDVMVENPPHAGLEGEVMPHPDLVKNLPAE